jgi:hypothetical protein
MAIGITRPTEKQEISFFLALVGFLGFTALGMYLVATVVTTLFR